MPVIPGSRVRAKPPAPPPPWGEIATYAAALAGWLLITAGIAALTTRVVWLLSSGLLLLALFGLRQLGVIVWFGVVAIAQSEEEAR